MNSTARLMTYNENANRQPQDPGKAIRLQPSWMPAVLELLRNTYASNPSVETIAARAGVHPVHLCRSFRKHQGMTIGQYLRRLKVDESRTLLAASGLSLSEIASRCGFCDQSHFSSVFKKVTGHTPGQYRAAAHPSSSTPLQA